VSLSRKRFHARFDQNAKRQRWKRKDRVLCSSLVQEGQIGKDVFGATVKARSALGLGLRTSARYSAMLAFGDDGTACEYLERTLRDYADGLIMASRSTAITKKSGDWWIGWIDEVPGAKAQEKSKGGGLSSLRRNSCRGFGIKPFRNSSGSRR